MTDINKKNIKNTKFDQNNRNYNRNNNKIQETFKIYE
jgi:hypothetical protein